MKSSIVLKRSSFAFTVIAAHALFTIMIGLNMEYVRPAFVPIASRVASSTVIMVTVVPSALAFAPASIPVAPPPPERFSTEIFLKDPLAASANARITVSVPPPAS